MRYFLCFIISAGISFFLHAQNDQKSLVLWYDHPASDWNQALPVGNGKLGAMIFGGIGQERIQLNEESVWTRRDTMQDKVGAYRFIPDIQTALFNEQIKEAEQLALDHLLSPRLPSNTNTYQTLGNLFLRFEHNEANVRYYARSLDLNNATVRVRYRVEDTDYLREIFASAPDQLLAVRLSASRPGKLSLMASLNRPGNNVRVWTENGLIKMREHIGENRGVVLETWLLPVAEGGTIHWHDSAWQVDHADGIVLYLVAATDYGGHIPEHICRERIEKLHSKHIDQIYEDHVSDYQDLFHRVAIELGTSQASLLPTDERIDAVKQGLHDPDLAELYFQYGRYLLISSSRPGSLPANLQGIWCEGLNPPWNSDYHININLQMNYWPAEVTNLAECHLPLFDFIENLVPNGQKTARTIYGCRGFVAHHTTDVWHPTTPFGRPVYGMWPMGAAWLVQHVWEHYEFNGDPVFLRERAWPLLKQAALFFIDFLVEDPQTGQYVSGPSMSPENSYYSMHGERVSMTMGPSMDQQIIYELLTNCIEACETMDSEHEFKDSLTSIRSKLATPRIGSDGRIMEWRKEYQEAEPGHRHISHLFALHPGTQLTHDQTPEFMKAAEKTLAYRLRHGGGHTGWSRAWIINFYARLLNSEAAYNNFQSLLASSTLPNLLDHHPPFQIDGNFGGCAGIAEMLLQSHESFIRVLPALPDQWSEGHIRGLRARGGFEIDIHWEEGELKSLKIRSILGRICRIVYKNVVQEFPTEQGMEYLLNPRLELQ